jgi:predicted MFS family arabinose efflux permease
VPFLLTLGLAPHLAAAGAALLLRGALMNLTVPLQASFTMDRLPPDIRGGGNALIWLAGQAARAAGTLAGGALIGAAGYRLPYPLAGALYTAAAVLFLWFAPARPAAPA